eukprot:4455857-Pleurochrysis_carterae.AAC.2
MKEGRETVMDAGEEIRGWRAASSNPAGEGSDGEASRDSASTELTARFHTAPPPTSPLAT